MKLKKSSILYIIGISALSIMQIILFYAILNDSPAINAPTELYVDGADFSPWLSLAQAGVNSFIDFLTVVFYTFFGAVISLIAMRILRRVSLRFFTTQTKKAGLIITLVAGVIFFLIGCIIVKFNSVLTLLTMYLPILLISFFAYNFGRKSKKK